MRLVIALIQNLLPDARILEAENGLEALKIVKSENVDLVFMDIQMPVMDGLEATREIRLWEAASEPYRRVPVVALTAGALKEEKEKALEHGVDEFLTKPIETEKLQKSINNLLFQIDPKKQR